MDHRNQEKNVKTLGIIGGMGPAATAEFLRRIVCMTKATRDQDHIPTIVLSDPSIPDRTECIKNDLVDDLAETLSRKAKVLSLLKCDVLAMPCNTAHVCIDEIEKSARGTLIVNMPLETVKLVFDLGLECIGLLATSGTVEAGVYQRYARKLGIQIINPSYQTQNSLDGAIYQSVKAGRRGAPESLQVAEHELQAKGCDCSVIACTELSILANELQEECGLTRIDSLDVLAWQSIRAAGASAEDLVARYSHE